MRPDRNGTVLLAEDEPEVRSYLEMALRCHGYHIETAQDGEEVLAYLQSGASVSAVLLDIIMPQRRHGDATRNPPPGHRIAGDHGFRRGFSAQHSGGDQERGHRFFGEAGESRGASDRDQTCLGCTA